MSTRQISWDRGDAEIQLLGGTFGPIRFDWTMIASNSQWRWCHGEQITERNMTNCPA